MASKRKRTRDGEASSSAIRLVNCLTGKALSAYTDQWPKLELEMTTATTTPRKSYLKLWASGSNRPEGSFGTQTDNSLTHHLWIYYDNWILVTPAPLARKPAGQV